MSPLEFLVSNAAEIWGTSAPMICGQRRDQRYAEPRHAVMYVAAEVLKMKKTEIGAYLGRDHTSVLHGIRVIEERRQRDSKLWERLEQLSASVPLAPLDYDRTRSVMGDWLMRGLQNIATRDPERFRALVAEINAAA